MSRISFSSARTGRRARSNGGGTVKQFEWEMGSRKRIIFPIVDNNLVLLAKPYHKVMNKSLVLPRSNGNGVYTIDKVRCTHPYSQTSNDVGYKLAKTGELCLFCQTAMYEERRMWADIEAQYGDSFKEMTKEQKKEIFKLLEEQKTVDKSYYTETTADGETFNSTLMDIFILALDVHTDAQGTVITDVDANGVAVPRYDVVLMPASKARLDKFKSSLEGAVLSGTIPRTMLHPIIENEGTDMEEEVLIGYVDFMVTFPVKVDKMASGKDMSVTPVAESMSVAKAPLMESFNAKAETVTAEAEQLFDRLFVNLKVHTNADAKEMFAVGSTYFDELEAQFRNATSFVNNNGGTVLSDEEKEQSMLATVIENYEKYNKVVEVEQPTAETVPPTQATTPPPTTVAQTPPTAVAQTPPPTAVAQTPPPTAVAQTPPPTAVAQTPPPTAVAQTPPPTAVTPATLDDSVFDV